ncbi:MULTISPECIES: carbohydrate ABC transporter permease [Paenibacillus sonchi group]|uniref:Binding-protein-dependent transport system inner membrane protein n=1 Tax=Paenibacillus riograndensis SBR5 TaxID=1073571 RepID=A0A0E4HDY8_9BACL|nr:MULTISPECIES: carbohydrate ABC transporter permease [Paenibacillus sonchi group]MCE3202678.1 carbohydrate ABC transporter permease [Paenibacillus sonchi]CQR57665.1 binding-protein-dependent transport system inner membrane protein [Paenibacillus riograndensis SBR5]
MSIHRKRSVTSFLLTSLTWFIVVVTIFPILWMIFTSLHSNDQILNGITTFSLPKPQWVNYVNMWDTVNFAIYFRNSLLICGATTLLAGAFAVLAGYALARFDFPGSKLFSMSIISTQLIPGIMFLFPIYLMFLWIKNTFGLPMINTYWGMILVYTAFYTPISIWIMRGFFVSIPRDLEESAVIDGCSKFQAFYKIILPLSVPGIIATGIFIFLTAWDELLFAWVLTTSSDVQTIPVGIRLFVGQYNTRYDLLMAASTVVTVPVMVIFFMTQKYFISGMTAGAVKG